MPDDPSNNAPVAPPDQGRAGWDQVGRQDQLHWSDQRPSEDERASVPPEQDHDRNANLDRGPRDDDGFVDFQARKDGDTPETNWDQDDFRRTEFAGSLDGTSHPQTPPDIDGDPAPALRPD